MMRTIISTDDLERARSAYAAAWLREDQRERPDGQPGDRTRAGLKAALAELGIAVAVIDR